MVESVKQSEKPIEKPKEEGSAVEEPESFEEEVELLETVCQESMRVYDDQSIRIQMYFSEVKHCSIVFRFSMDEKDEKKVLYPQQKALFEMKSTVISPKLTNLLLKRVEAHMEERFKAGKLHVFSAFTFLENILQNNNLIPAFSEFAQIKSVIDSERGDELKTFEKAGKLKITLKEKKKFAVFELLVPPNYPLQAVKVTLKDHNFNQVFASIFMQHATQIVQRLWGGGSAGYDEETKGDINEGKIGFKKAVGKYEADMARIAIATRAELKHDMDFLKKQAELRNGNMDKQARRAFKLNLKHEKRYEEALAKRVEEEKKIADSLDKFGKINHTSAKPQIYHVVNYLANYFVRFLPSAKCLHCNESLVQNQKKGDEEGGLMPERAFCGHWLHYKCFEEFVNTPNFKRPCPYDKCDKTLASQNFECSVQAIKNREKRWTNEQAKLGEADQMAILFGL